MKSNDWYPRVGMVLSLLVYGASACAVENADFVVKDIRLDGLVRVPASTVYGILPIAAGDHVDESRIADSLKKLSPGKFFNDLCGFNKKNKLGLKAPSMEEVKKWCEQE